MEVFMQFESDLTSDSFYKDYFTKLKMACD
jgi:hypothetical protein